TAGRPRRTCLHLWHSTALERFDLLHRPLLNVRGAHHRHNQIRRCCPQVPRPSSRGQISPTTTGSSERTTTGSSERTTTGSSKRTTTGSSKRQRATKPRSTLWRGQLGHSARGAPPFDRR